VQYGSFATCIHTSSLFEEGNEDASCNPQSDADAGAR
jgi:hypothetical protein